MIQLEEQKIQLKFLNGIQNRGLTPSYNVGGGNCVFISLAQIVFGDASKFKFMRYMIIHRLQSFPEKYQGEMNNFSDYCDRMAVNGKVASPLLFQAIADICFSVVECYSINDFLVPFDIIYPLRFSTIDDCKGRIRLWIQGSHCMALVDHQSQPLIKNIFP